MDKKEVKKDKIFLFIWTIIASLISFIIQANSLDSTILFLFKSWDIVIGFAINFCPP